MVAIEIVDRHLPRLCMCYLFVQARPDYQVISSKVPKCSLLAYYNCSLSLQVQVDMNTVQLL